jgi:SAM-dependent methyltransferase
MAVDAGTVVEGLMSKAYRMAYRIGVTPWERYRDDAGTSIGAVLDREVHERPPSLGRALDLGCGRGGYAVDLARRGWQAVGVDAAPEAIDEARRDHTAGARFVVGDVTQLWRAELGMFDFFLDIGCFQGLNAQQRLAEGRCVTGMANPGATLLMLSFGPTRLRRVIGGVSRTDVEDAFSGWQLLSVEPADTAGLGWPMNRTSPQWYRLRHQR